MTSTPTDRPQAGRYAVVAVCFAAIIFDGYDLIIYGSTLPALLDHEPWALTPSQAGAIGSYALLGMFFGAIAAGTLTDRFGRRKLFLGCLLWYSTAMVAVALAPTPGILGVLRFVAGLGFGGIAPVAIALVVEVARPDERNRLNAMMLAGMPVGGIVAALLALLFLDDIGFRGLWMVGALAIVFVFPLAYRVIPETVAQASAVRGARRPARELASGRALTSLVLFAVANFVGFLLVFGLNIWLPELMRKAFDEIDAALAEGELVGIFPEGALTKDGEIAPFKSGVEHILERAAARGQVVPVVPMALRNMWTSMWSRRDTRLGQMRVPRRFRAPVEVMAQAAILDPAVDAATLEAKVRAMRGDAA